MTEVVTDPAVDPAADPANPDPAADPAAAPPEWLGQLPEELRADPTLGRYKSLEELARGHVEAHKVAKSKVQLPGADADDAAWGRFGETLRPETPDAYDIPLPEGVDPEGPQGKFAKAFRGMAHEIGLPARWASQLASWNNEYQAGEITAANTAMQAELAAFKAETPDFDAKATGAAEMLNALGVDELTATELELRLGTPKMLKLVFELYSKFGEAVRVDPANRDPSLAGGDTADAAAQLREFDKDNREKILEGDPATVRRRRQLTDAANAQGRGSKPKVE